MYLQTNSKEYLWCICSEIHIFYERKWPIFANATPLFYVGKLLEIFIGPPNVKFTSVGISGLPLGKPGKMGRHFPVRESQGIFEPTGKVRENDTKYWKIQGISKKYYLLFLVIFKWTVYYLLTWTKLSVKNQNLKKYWKSQGILLVQKSGSHGYKYSWRFVNLEYSWKGQFFVQMKVKKFTDLYSKQVGNYFKNNFKIPGNLL